VNRHPVILLAGLFSLLAPLQVRGQAAFGLEKTDKGFKHPASATEFLLPPKWMVLEPRALPSGVSLGLNFPDPQITVTLYWVPLEGTPLSEFVRLKPEGPAKSFGREHDALKLVYGEDKVGKPEQLKSGERAVFKIPVLDGPERDGKSAGVLYVFEAGPDEKKRWRIKLRATYPKQGEALHAKTVEALLGLFK
jgi:hypothetical protein